MANLLIISATSASNLELAKRIAEQGKETFSKVDVLNLEDLSLPLYTPLQEANGIPEDTHKFRDALSQHDAFIICAPEYNGNIPPIVNNAICWVSRSTEDWRSAFNQKLAVVATSSGGVGFKYQQSMKLQLEHLGAVVLPRTIAVGGGKEFNPKSCDAILEQLKNLIK